MDRQCRWFWYYCNRLIWLCRCQSYGNYILEYIKVDAAGNTGSVTRTVNVIAAADVIPPTVSLVGSGTFTLEASTGTYLDAGASWVDNLDGSGSVLDATFVLSGSVDLHILGTYTLSYTKTDTSGNTGSTIRTVIVQDTTVPNITLSGSAIMSVIIGGSFTDPGATWSDNLDGT